MNLAPESDLTSTLRLLRKLGEGGMGSVWIAEHKGLATEVVVKFMSPDLARYEPSVARFSQEAALAAKVRHPHVVQVFDHGVSEAGLPFIVMELLEGRTLADELDARPRLLPGEVSAIVSQTAKALQRVHELGLVHRDIKPENIFLCALGNGETFVKILDFGIAKARGDLAGSLTSTGMTMGTPYYMSPELIVSAKYVDGQADLWALAVVAFEGLTGVRPFEGETVAAVTLELHAETRRRVTELVPSLPRELDAWFARAFTKNPADRFPDARTMARALAAIVPPMRSSMAPEEPPVSSRSLPIEPIEAEKSVTEETTETLGTLTVTAPPARGHGRFLAAAAAIAAMSVVGFFVGRRERSAAAAVDERMEPLPALAIAPSAQPFVAPSAAPSSASAAATTTVKLAPPRPVKAVKKSSEVPKTFDDIE